MKPPLFMNDLLLFYRNFVQQTRDRALINIKHLEEVLPKYIENQFGNAEIMGWEWPKEHFLMEKKNGQRGLIGILKSQSKKCSKVRNWISLKIVSIGI